MRLSKKSINELRKVVEEELMSYEKSELVKFSNTELDMLLFNPVGKVKYTAWTGPFLRKIDLSEVSFAKVLFDAEEIIKRGLEDEKFIIDLSGTNAKIDFKTIVGFEISKCDFSNMDLSEANFTFINRISGCKFNNSTINFACIHGDLLKKSLADEIERGAFDGAYINGKRMLTKNEKQEKAEEIRRLYETLQENTKKKIIKTIHKK